MMDFTSEINYQNAMDEFYLPEPPLARINWSENARLIDIFNEDWDEGTDTK